MEQLDDTDRKILEQLRQDSRVSYTDLAKKFDMSDVAIKKRIDKLVEQGIIKNFSVSIDNKKLGKPLHAFMLLRSTPGETTTLSEKLRKTDGVANIFQTLGPFDLMIEANCASMDELRALSEEKIGNLSGVIEVRTLVAIE